MTLTAAASTTANSEVPYRTRCRGSSQRPRWGIRWRSSVWYITFIVGLGISVDLLVYSIVIPVLPFRLESLKYTGVSGLVGWLLFAYSGGLVISTLPIAAFSERYHNRKYPLVAGQLFLIGSQILLMEARTYWVMILARVLQGVSSSMIWVVGLALLCDSVPERILGRQLGTAMMGMSLGILVGPPAGGALYDKFGFRGPCVLGILVTSVDLVGRMLIIEPSTPDPLQGTVNEAAAIAVEQLQSNDPKIPREPPANIVPQVQEVGTPVTRVPLDEELAHAIPQARPLSLIGVLLKLLRSPRAISVLLSTLVYGIVYSSQEPVIPLYLQARWGLTSDKVGLVYLAAVIPTFFSSPLAGWVVDLKGTEWITVLIFCLSIPWWVLIAVRGTLAYFIVMLAIESFFTAAVVSPLTAELAAVSRTHAGVGYAHVYGAFNMCYGVGASIGPIIAGQMYDHVGHAWTAICLLATGLLATCSLLALWSTGDSPLLSRLTSALSRRRTIALAHN